jgi:hypothetical protein
LSPKRRSACALTAAAYNPARLPNLLKIAFGALSGQLDVRYSARDGSACAEFSWEGQDENDLACGRGWAMIGTAGRLVGHFYIHKGDDSGFVCERR